MLYSIFESLEYWIPTAIFAAIALVAVMNGRVQLLFKTVRRSEAPLLFWLAVTVFFTIALIGLMLALFQQLRGE